MLAMEQADLYLLDYQQLDNDHAEFINTLNRLIAADDSQFASLFEQLMHHTQQHFDRENALMDEYNFPATGEHKGEHQRVLGEFTQFKKRVDKGLIAFGRAYVKENLPAWFDLHVKTMDSALVAHIKTRIAAQG